MSTQSKSQYNRFRRFMLRHPAAFHAWRLGLTAFGHIEYCWLEPQITADQIDQCYRILWPKRGAVLGVYSRRFPTGLCLPKGKYGVEHTAWYLGYGQVLEAVTPRTRIIPLRQFLERYDRVVIGFVDLPRPQQAFERAMNLNGRQYDVLFGGDKRSVYCHETVSECLAAGGRTPERTGEFWLADDVFSACDKIIQIDREVNENEYDAY